MPFFIGLFDTVASLRSFLLSAALLGGSALLLAAVSFAQSFLLFPFLPTFLTLAGAGVLAAAVGYAVTHIKFAAGLPGHWWHRWHFASPKMKFYDLHLNNKVWYARHALSIDENRADFARVVWGGVHNKGPERPEEFPDWLQQVRFAGNHSDVGGSYPENEARLSDISLGWMVHAAVNLPDGNARARACPDRRGRRPQRADGLQCTVGRASAARYDDLLRRLCNQQFKTSSVALRDRDKNQPAAREDVIGQERVLALGSRPSPTGDAEKTHPVARRGNQMGRWTPDDAVGWMTVIPDAQAFERHCDCGRRRVSKGILPQTEARAPEKGFAGLFRIRNSGGQQLEHRNERSFGGASASRGL